MRKEIPGEGGKTRFGPLPGPPYRIEEREDCLTLVYRPPFSMLVDEIRKKSEDLRAGKAMLGGRIFGRQVSRNEPETSAIKRREG